MGQQAPAAPAPAAPAPTVATAPASVTTTYSGVPGFVETVAVLGVSAAAAYTGVRAGMNKTMNKTNRIAGWVGGIGAALVGLLYLGGKTGVSRQISLPSVQVIP
jgi:small basic protein